jgi:1,2-diacylglycerol 3-beta-galactosyltransferase
MILNPSKKPHVLLLFSDTGGGHRSAAEAIIEALHLEFGDAVSTEMVDVFKEHSPTPLNRMPDWYPYMVKLPQVWGASFRASNGRTQARAITATLWPVASRVARKIINSHPADLIVTVHPLANSWMLKALGKKRPPFVTVVTDMVTTHSLWFDHRSDMTLVPTQAAYAKAIQNGMKPHKVRVVGQPIARKYCVASGDKEALRTKLGWAQQKFTVLIIGGGEGMGPLEKNARAINDSGLDVAIVVVAGRNEKLKKRLEEQEWRVPIKVYGFTRELPDFMRASDVLITKAGPGTIAESLAAELPIILYSKLPGQEDGNVTFVEEESAGVWAPRTDQMLSVLREWVNDPVVRERYVDACRKAAMPDASIKIARAVGERIGLIEPDLARMIIEDDRR